MKRNRVATVALSVGALGVVFGDIGTSPLYALPAIFSLGRIGLSEANVLGIVSLIFWAILITVSIKYVAVIMRVDNHGEGGNMTLLSLLLKAKLSRRALAVITLIGLIGISLFFGDGVITPAISLLASVEGIATVLPDFSWVILPVAIVLATVLFALQHKGTGKIGAFFGPVMIVWFGVSALAGVSHIIQHPVVFEALLPSTALLFVLAHPLVAFVSLGAVILAVTGAEALYADMGHFGRPAIARAWFFLVFPALTLCYLGQGALIIAHPEAISHAYFLLYPEFLRGAAVVLATVATMIASQAVIAGAFSLIAQAMRLGLAPRGMVRHTSTVEEGQVYIAGVNWVMYGLVVALMIGFGASGNLASAFGLSVAGTLLIDTILFLLVLVIVKQWHWYGAVAACVAFLVIDGLFVASGTTKILHGAWVSLVIGGILFVILTTWARGRQLINHERKMVEGSLDDFVRRIRRQKVPRIDGTAVYLGHHYDYAPLALVATLNDLHELPHHVIIVSAETVHQPHVAMHSRATLDDVGFRDDGIVRVHLRFGFKDVPNIPLTLKHIKPTGEFQFDPDTVSYFVSSSHVELSGRQWLSRWRKRLFSFMERNAASRSDYFHLPPNHTVDIAAHLEI